MTGVGVTAARSFLPALDRPRRNVARAACAALIGMFIYVVVALAVTPPLQALFPDPQRMFFPLTYFNDGAKYVAICTQGYSLPVEAPLPGLGYSRVSWMPLYPALQCALHNGFGVSMVVAGFYISALAAGISLFFGALTLGNLGLKAPALHTFAAFISPVGAAWIFIAGAEATYLALSMFLMWLLTLPMPDSATDTSRTEWGRMLIGVPLGLALMLAKPNALQLLLPLAFAFIWLSWKRSTAIGYEYSLFNFTTDILVEHLALPLALVQRLRGKRLGFDPRLMIYDWAPICVGAGILLGFAGWQVYSSFLSGVPLYALEVQLAVWRPQWNSGNVIRMIQYFAQAFHGASRATYWRVDAAWYLAANLMPLIPAASRRVPALIRGMLVCMPVFLLISGNVNGTDRHLLSTGLMVIGWACWLAPVGQVVRWSALRWALLITLAVVNGYLMLYHVFTIGSLGLSIFKW